MKFGYSILIITGKTKTGCPSNYFFNIYVSISQVVFELLAKILPANI